MVSLEAISTDQLLDFSPGTPGAETSNAVAHFWATQLWASQWVLFSSTESVVTCYIAMESNTQSEKIGRGKSCMYQTEKQKRDIGRGKRSIWYFNGGSAPLGYVFPMNTELEIFTLNSKIGASLSLNPRYSAGQASMLDFLGHYQRFTFPRPHPLAIRCIPQSLCQPATGSDICVCPQRERQHHWLRANEVQPYKFADGGRTLERTEFETVLQPHIGPGLHLQARFLVLLLQA